MADLGFGWDAAAQMGRRGRGHRARTQAAITDIRAGRPQHHDVDEEAGKPVSFIEDCAVPLKHLAEYTERSPRSSPGTAPAAPGMRMPRWAACTCGRC